jgi:DNA-binding transcriptional ArsR family regulator
MARKKNARRKKFKGFPPPGEGPETPVTNEFFDVHLRDMTGVQTVVLMAIIRRAWVNHSDRTEMPREELAKMVGAGLRAISNAVAALEGKGLIEVERERYSSRGRLPNIYTLKIPNPYDGSLSPEEIAQLRKESRGGAVA